MKSITPIALTALTTLALAAGGCQYTTQSARDRAAALAAQVRTYHAQQQERVEQINKEFHARYTQLVAEHQALTASELLQDRDAEAQRIADELVSLDGSSLRQKFRDRFARTVTEDRKAIDNAEIALAQTRAAYKLAYQDAAIPLSKLERAENNLARLASKENELGTAADLTSKIITQYQKLQNETRQTPSAPTGSTGKAGK